MDPKSIVYRTKAYQTGFYNLIVLIVQFHPASLVISTGKHYQLEVVSTYCALYIFCNYVVGFVIVVSHQFTCLEC